MAMAGASQLTHALSHCSISCTSIAAAANCRSISSSFKFPASGVAASSSLWGTKLEAVRTSKASRARSRSVAMATWEDDDYEETPEEIQAGYEALYGKAFGQSSPTRKWDGEDTGEDDDGGRARRGGISDKPMARRDGRGGAKGDFEERVVQIRRVTKVVKGGKQLSFRAVVVVGDKKGKVGVGCNKAKEVITAVQKASLKAKRNLVNVPMTKYKTFPHRADGHFGAAHVMLRPASVGTGVIAGGAVRIVLELAGVENALGKQIGSENPLNNARAVVEAISTMKTFRQVSIDRGIPMEELWK